MPPPIEMLIPPFSQLLIISIIVYIALGVVVLLKSSRKDMRILFTFLTTVAAVSNLAASISVYVQNTKYLSNVVGTTTVLLPAIFSLLIMYFLHEKKIGKRVYFSILMFLFAAIICAIFLFPGDGLVRPASLFLYVCICFSVPIGELILEKQPGYELMVVGSSLLFFEWLFYLQGFLTHWFGDVSTTVMAAQFVSSFFLLPIAIGILRADPVIVPKRKVPSVLRRPRRIRLNSGTTYLLVEKRPKYSYAIFTELVNDGFPGLLITRKRKKNLRERYGLHVASIIELKPLHDKNSLSPKQLGRIFATIKGFLYEARNGVVLLDNVEYLFSNNYFFDVIELIRNLNKTVQSSSGLLIIPLSLLIDTERKWLKELRCELVTAPDPEDEVSSVLTNAFGDFGPEILDQACNKIGVRREELILTDLPIIAKEIGSIAADFEGSLGHKKLSSYWQQESQKATELIKRLGVIQQSEIDRGNLKKKSVLTNRMWEWNRENVWI